MSSPLPFSFDDPAGAPPNEATLLAYFEGKLPAEEAHRVEEWLATETPEGDALEGLQMLPPAQTRQFSDRINSMVQQSAGKRDRSGRKKQPLSQGWSIAFAVVILVIVVVAAFLVIAYLKRAG